MPLETACGHGRTWDEDINSKWFYYTKFLGYGGENRIGKNSVPPSCSSVKQLLSSRLI